jgi:transcriptional regulator with XRE-family HTH domain
MHSLVKTLRAQANAIGATNSELAMKSGVKTERIERWFRGNDVPRVDAFAKVARAADLELSVTTTEPVVRLAAIVKAMNGLAAARSPEERARRRDELVRASRAAEDYLSTVRTDVEAKL